MDGKRYYSNYFSVYVDGQKKYNPLDYFRMRIIEEISFFFFDVEDPARNQKLCTEMMRKLKSRCVECEEKKG